MTRLEQLRVDLLLSRQQLAVKAGVSTGTIRSVELGNGAHVATLGKLAATLTGELRKTKPKSPTIPASELLREAFDAPSSAGSSERDAA